MEAAYGRVRIPFAATPSGPLYHEWDARIRPLPAGIPNHGQPLAQYTIDGSTWLNIDLRDVRYKTCVACGHVAFHEQNGELFCIAHRQRMPRCGCPVNAPEADPEKHPCPCGDHCTETHATT